MPRQLSAKPSEASHRVRGALDAVFSWSYSSEIDALRSLYAKGLDRQWNAMRDLPWDRGIDRRAFASGFTMGGFPIQETEFWKTLGADTQWEVARRGSAFMLSNFLHGEQGALMVASQLVNAVPHMDGKFYAATQTLDEARHVEVFAAYIEELDHIYPIAPSLQKLLDTTLGGDDWCTKCVGMQIVVEGLALYSFRDMRNATRDPLLKELLTYVGRDEARHTAYGIKYLGAVVPTLSPAEIEGLEDFAFEAARMLLDSRSGPTMREALLERFREGGVDPNDVVAALAREPQMEKIIAAMGGRRGPVSGFVIPTLQAIGLFSDRIEGHFRDLFAHMQGAGAKNIMDSIVRLPEDLDAWIEEGAR
jgi:P-aminobenzoate N-oxygenase AurF